MSDAIKPEPESDQSVVRYRAPGIRVLRTEGWDLNFEVPEALWLTVELSDRYRVAGRVSGRKVDRVGAVGGVHINPPGEALDLSIIGDYRAIQFEIPMSVVAQVAEEDHGLDGGRVRVDPLIGKVDWRLARCLFQAAARPVAEDAHELPRDVVSHLLLNYSSAAKRRVSLRRAGIAPVRLHRVIDFVEANLDRSSVERMAAEAGISPFHFTREFKRMTGQSPWSYVISRRLSQALKLLEDRERSVQEVARSSGFADASHLSHRMRERLGCSPSDVRRHLFL